VNVIYLAKKCADVYGRSLGSVYVLSSGNDPFAVNQPARLKRAHWFADVWRRLGLPRQRIHLRAIHYRIISQDKPVAMPNGDNYENTLECWRYLLDGARDARYLQLVPYANIIDARTEAPICHFHAYSGDAKICAEDGEDISLEPLDDDGGSLRIVNTSLKIWKAFEYPDVPDFPDIDLPILELTQPPKLLPRLHVEIWVEKSTMAEVLDPIAERYSANLVTGVGELSLTRCYELIERANASGRPVRILYLSDFDPGGRSMPIAVARKIEFMLRQQNLVLDIQVRPILLTHEQCIRYRLPRTPIKETERRAAKFEKLFGEGATELDALEALHPGELAKIVTREIKRYHDRTLQERVDDCVAELEGEIEDFNNSVHERHQDDIDAIEAERNEDIEALNKALHPLEGRFSEVARDFNRKVQSIEAEYKQHITAFDEKIGPIETQRDRLVADFNAREAEREARLNAIRQAVAEELRDRSDAPALDNVEWPEPAFNEDPSPVYDSGRDFIQQVRRFKWFQRNWSEPADDDE